MRPNPSGWLWCAAVACAALQGCAHQPSVLPRGNVTSFGPCDCGPSAPVVRGRLVPAPPPGTAGIGATPAAPLVPSEPVPVQPPPSQPPPSETPAPSWRPSTDAGARLATPETDEDPLLDPGARLTPPQTKEPPPAPSTPPQAEPAGPVDIPQFTEAKKQVASGLKPFADGLTWLKKNGYRTVLHLRAPGEDNTAIRRQIEAKGLRYLSLEVSPTAVARDSVVDDFIRAVNDKDNLPLYVFDREGALAGGLWYLYFRIEANLSDEAALRKAADLGLRTDDADGAHKDMVLAVQSYLTMKKAKD